MISNINELEKKICEEMENPRISVSISLVVDDRGDTLAHILMNLISYTEDHHERSLRSQYNLRGLLDQVK